MMQYHIEQTSPDLPEHWQPIEHSQETAPGFSDPEMAECFARALALHADGEIAYRVIDALGTRCLVVRVAKYLQVTKPSVPVPFVSEAIPSECTGPVLSRLMQDDRLARVFLVPAIPNPQSPEGTNVCDLMVILSLLVACLVDWLELDEGCTCAGSSERPCLTCSSQYAVRQAQEWLSLHQTAEGEPNIPIQSAGASAPSSEKEEKEQTV